MRTPALRRSPLSRFVLGQLVPIACFVACSVTGGDPTAGEAAAGGSGAGPGSGGTNPTGVGGAGGTTVGGNSGTMTGGSAGTGVGGTTGTGGNDDPNGCAAGVLIDDLEDQATWPEWEAYNDGTAGGTMTPPTPFAAETSTEGGNAVHLSGSGFTLWGAGVGRKFDATHVCVERSKGFKFRAKGPGTMTVAAPIAAVVPTAQGGTCTAGDECNNGHETTVTLTTEWAEYEILWTSLSQSPDWGLKAPFDKASVLTIEFAARPDQMPFDFWIDDIQLVDGGPPGGTGGTGGTGGGGDCVLDGILGEDGFLQWYSARRNSFYTYANLCTALEQFPGFAATPDADANKREVAAFFANVSRETGELDYIDQIVKDPATGNYYGRGPLQLTWDYNYSAAGSALGLDLIGNPNLLSTDGVATWLSALWFWMDADGAGKGTCHGAITGGQGFGQTINIINGGLECGGPNEAANQRIQYYQTYTASLGVDPGGNLECW